MIEGVEEEQFIFSDRAAETSENVVREQVVAVGRGAVWPAPTLEGVQARAMDLQHRAAVKVIRAVLGDRLHDRPCAMAVLGVIGAYVHLDLLDRLRVGRNHRGAVPGLAVRGNAVE